MRDALVIDPWTPLDYKQVFGSGLEAGGAPRNAPWLTARDRRRLSAYLVLAAYSENSARHLVSTDDDRSTERREYGDAGLIIEQALSALLGDEQRITIPLAEGYDPDAVDDPDTADEPDADAAAAWDMLQRLEEWWDAENLPLTVLDSERKALTLGDSVYLLWWDGEKQRPRVTVIDPGFYFPVEPEGLVGDAYPTRVHFLWEIPAEETPDKKARLTRITYELGPITAEPVAEPEAFLWGRPQPEPVLREGDIWHTGDDGVTRPARLYPWSDEPSTTTCYLTEATWLLEDAARGGRTSSVDTLDMSRATFKVRDDGAVLDRFDLRLDFLPVIHVPNTVPGGEHFGQSILAKAAQVLDDLQSADTDTDAAAATTGSPMLAISDVQVQHVRDPLTGRTAPQEIRIGPGKVFSLGSGGSMNSVDTSSQLAEMRNRVKDLRSRLTQNVRIPDVALGIVNESDAAMSGVAIQLRYGPMESLIRSLRLVRRAKFPILLKFVQRMLMLADKYDGPTQTFPSNVTYGSFLPKDLEGTMTRVAEAYAAGVISLETAVAMLIQTGLPIDDAIEEMERIQSRQFKAAGDLADATGRVEDAIKFLGLEPSPVVPAGTSIVPAPGPAVVVEEDLPAQA